MPSPAHPAHVAIASSNPSPTLNRGEKELYFSSRRRRGEQIRRGSVIQSNREPNPSSFSLKKRQNYLFTNLPGATGVGKRGRASRRCHSLPSPSIGRSSAPRAEGVSLGKRRISDGSRRSRWSSPTRRRRRCSRLLQAWSCRWVLSKASRAASARLFQSKALPT